MEYFDFIADQKFRNILARDFKELERKCIENKTQICFNSFGSIIEGYFT